MYLHTVMLDDGMKDSSGFDCRHVTNSEPEYLSQPIILLKSVAISLASPGTCRDQIAPATPLCEMQPLSISEKCK